MTQRDTYSWEIYRINQFKAASKDEAQFRHKLFTRASRCSEAKRNRFIEALKVMGLEDIATFIEFRRG